MRGIFINSRSLSSVIDAESRNFDGASIEKMLEKHGSPLFLISERVLLERYELLETALAKYLPNSQIAYSYKTNYLPYLCKFLKNKGALAEVVSGFEYILAKKLNYEGPHIIFNGPLKREEDLKRALADGAIINIDNREELVKITRLIEGREIKYKKYKIGIRVNSRNAALNMRGWTRFGFNIENGDAAEICYDIQNLNDHLQLSGLHMHIGTNIAHPKLYELEVKTLISFAQKINQEFGVMLEYIDLGGGFGVQNLQPRDRQVWDVPPIDNFIAAIAKGVKPVGGHLPKLIIEPGRYLVSDCTTLVTRALSVKRPSANTQEVTVDASISILPTAKTHFHKICALRNAGELLDTTIFGSSCMQTDVLGLGLFPPLKEGDVLLIENAGAYSISRASQFISPRPPVLWIDTEGEVRIVRRREEAPDLINLDLLY